MGRGKPETTGDQLKERHVTAAVVIKCFRQALLLLFARCPTWMLSCRPLTPSTGFGGLVLNVPLDLFSVPAHHPRDQTVL